MTARPGPRALAIAVGVAIVVALAALLVLRRRAAPPAEAPAPAAAAAPPASGVAATVVLDDDAEARAGLALGTAAEAHGGGELEAYGQVLDPVPLAEAVFARTAARTTLDIASKEYQRVKALHRNDANASTRELESADAAFQRARFDLELAQARLASTWGAELAGRSDLDDLVHGLAQRRVALARLDLPAGEPVAGDPEAVAVRSAAGRGEARPAQLLGPAPTTDPSVQGRGFLVLLDPGSPPGTALVGRIAFPDRRVAGVLVPRSAVVWHDEEAFVYVSRGAGRFERRAVELHGDGAGEGDWLVTGALTPGDRIVVTGASLLLSAEQTGGEASD